MVLDIDTSNSTFSDLRANGFLYVDKTYFFHRMITKGKMFFCARPRRFGKTLAVSTLEAIFQGKRELFKGLYIDSTDYDWKTYPVIHVNFADCSEKSGQELDDWIRDLLVAIGRKYQIILDPQKPCRIAFKNLLEAFQDRGEKVVILIDEYDKVVSDNLNNPELQNLQQVLSSFYSVIKAYDSIIRFAFLTGVTKYAKLSVFSGMNNLRDISMDPDYATMFGYTEAELEQNFVSYIDSGCKAAGMARDEYLAKLKDMYDGYTFSPNGQAVYNPVSVGSFFDEGGRTFIGYWTETGGTKLLMDVASEVDFNLASDLDEAVSESDMSSFDITRLAGSDVSALERKWLLYQTGYLTIDRVEDGILGERRFFLRFPNREVEVAFSNRLLSAYSAGRNGSRNVTLLERMFRDLEKDDTASFMETLASLLAGLPYGTKPVEQHFQAMVALICRLYKSSAVECEPHTSRGRIDMMLRLRHAVYLFEFKVDQSPDVALKQIHDKHYADRYKIEHLPIHLVGISFSSKTRNISDWKEEIV